MLIEDRDRKFCIALSRFPFRLPRVRLSSSIARIAFAIAAEDILPLLPSVKTSRVITTFPMSFPAN